MKKESQTFESITSAEFAKRYEPVRGFILAEKLLTPEISKGGIVIPGQTRDGSNAWKGAAVVLKTAKTEPEDAREQYMQDIIREGDIVGFGATTPILAPAPAHLQFENPEGQNDRTVTLHVTDVIGVYLDTDEKRKEFYKRLADAKETVYGER